MRGKLRWVLLSNALWVGVVLGVALFHRGTGAPYESLSQGAELTVATPLPERPEPIVTPSTDAPPLLSAAVALTRPQSIPVPIFQSVRAPILMYHHIDAAPASADVLRKSLSISPSDFDAQVRFLRDRRFVSLALNDLYDALQGNRVLPPKPVVLTFDDGYADDYLNAFPVLKRYGFVGTFFILTDVMGTGEYVSWDQAKDMAAAGMKIEPHGRTHADLTRLTAAGVNGQTRGAREAIQAKLGIIPQFYCYPSGKYNKDVTDVIKANGYLGAVTTNYGSDHSLDKVFELKRVRIDGRESFSVFAAKVGEKP